MLKEFADFLKEYKIPALAIAFVMGSASTTLVNSLVKDIVMPIVEPIMPGDAWRDAIVSFGPVNIALGSFMAELINFIILAFIIFIIVKKLIKQDESENK
jgi:large conductance mechanosensitive channel